MTNENLDGKIKLVRRIVEEAEADARRVSDDARCTAERIRSEGESAAEEKRAVHLKAREESVRTVIDGCRTRAAIDGKKMILQKKREIIDLVFSRAYESLLALDAAQRGAICRSLLLREAEDGERVKPAKADRKAIADALKKGGLPDLRLDDSDEPHDGGFTLVGDGYEKDCSFASLIRELRDAEETAVAGLLFH